MQIKKILPRSSSEKGQAIVIIVFAIIGLIGISAVAIDGTNAFIDNRRAETAASAAALTGALTRIEGGDWRASALSVASANGYDNNGETNIVELNTPPLSGPYAGNSEYIEVIITSKMRTYFANVIGIPYITSVVKAVSQSKPSVLGEMFPGYALVSLAPKSGCDTTGTTAKRPAFWVHSEATMNLEGGGVFVNSSHPSCAFISFGSGSVRVHDNDKTITVVGDADVQKPKLISPYPFQTNAPYIPYPPPYKMPQVGCGDKIAEVNELDGTMTAGNWDEDIFPPEGVTHLNGGIYCLSGDFVLNGGQELSGGAVLIYVEEGSVHINGNATVKLQALRNGPLEGLLIYMPSENKSILAISGSDDSRYQGTILAPGADVRINGLNSVSGAAYHSQIIGYTIEIDGSDNIFIKYKDEQNWDTWSMPAVALGQ